MTGACVTSLITKENKMRLNNPLLAPSRNGPLDHNPILSCGVAVPLAGVSA